MTVYHAYFDGSCKPNPGTMKVWGHINKDGVEIYKFSKEIGPGTNNHSEFLALYQLCLGLTKLEIKEATIFGDSQLVVKIMLGKSKGKANRLLNVKHAILKLWCKKWKLEHVPRKMNMRANRLSH